MEEQAAKLKELYFVFNKKASKYSFDAFCEWLIR
jgi:hypothetical protein